MSNFREVLDIEKKYDFHINTAKKNHDKNLESAENEFRLKEEVYKEDYKKIIEHDNTIALKSFRETGKKILKKAEDEAEYIKKNIQHEKAVNLLMKKFENV